MCKSGFAPRKKKKDAIDEVLRVREEVLRVREKRRGARSIIPV